MIQLFSIDRIYLSDSRLFIFGGFPCSHIGAYPNIRAILKPDGAVEVLDELTLHPEDLQLVELADVVADLVGLLQTVPFLVVLYQLLVFTQRSEVVLDGGLRIIEVNRRKEVNQYGCTTSKLSFYVCLNAVDLIPVGFCLFGTLALHQSKYNL